MIYGLFDTEDKVWMGDKSGPLLYTDPQAARLCAMVVSDRFNWPVTRVRARPYDNTGNKLRDELECARTAEESLERLESGSV